MSFVALSSLAAILLMRDCWLLYFNCVVAVCILYVFIVVPLVCLQDVIVAFPGHTHLLLCDLAVLVF